MLHKQKMISATRVIYLYLAFFKFNNQTIVLHCRKYINSIINFNPAVLTHLLVTYTLA